MTSGRVYNHFHEIADEIKSNAPSVLYKYRDWDNDNHKSILTKNIAWFPNPKDLNDPYDIRVPVRFNLDEVNYPGFFERLKFHALQQFPNYAADSREFRVISENKLDEIKQNPAKYFEERYLELRESNLYDEIGLFSLSSNPLDETMWAHYSNNSQGFCVGFNTSSLVKELKMIFGRVKYNDIPPLHSFLANLEDNQDDETLLKHTKWSNEAEWRFLTFGIKKDIERAKKIPKDSVVEVIVGEKISTMHLQEIKYILTSRYKNNVKLYQVKAGLNYGYLKQELIY